MEKQPLLMPNRDDQTPPFKGPIRTPPSFQGPMHSSTIMGSGSPSAYSERSLLTLREEETPEHIPSSLYEGISGYQVSMPETSPELDDSLPMVHGDYEDFHTIDWPRELARDRMRHRHLVKRKPESLMNRVYFEFDAISGWLCVFMIGVCAGLVAGAIDIGTSWMVDLRNGICPQRFWLNMEQCCWSSNETLYEGYKCSQWYSWSEMVGVYSSGAGQYVVDFIVYTIVSVSFALLAVFLIRTFAPYAVGGGIPELKTILSGFIIRGHLGKWTLIIKSVGVMLSVSAGLCLGKEGPLVHVACCIGNIIARLFPKFGNNEAKKREILSAAAAAGVSVAFGAPIGGVLFSLEEASYYFPLKTLWRSFFCALIAAFFLRSINPFGNDHMIAFYADYSTPWALIELIPFVFIGILGGLIGCMFIKGNVYWCKLRKNSKLGEYPIGEVLAVTLLTALMSFHNPYTRMDTSSLIAKLVRQCSPDEISDLCGYESNISSVHEVTHKALEGATLSRTLWQLILALIFKLGMMTVTIGMKVPAGLYIPSLAVGAIMGRIIGIGMEQIAALYPDSKVFPGEYGENCITPGMYAMVGAAAVLGGVTRMTVSLVVVMFEVTGGVRYIVPLMVAVMASKWVGDGISRRGIFEQLIELNNYPYLDNKEEFEYTTLACDVMKPNKKEPLVVLLQDSMTVGDVELLLKSYQYNAFPVVVSKESQYLVGLVLRKDLQMALANARAKHGSITAASMVIFTEHAPRPWRRSPAVKLRKIVDLAPITITDQTPMETVIDMFKKLGLRQTLVIHSGKLLGCITRKDVLRHIKALENEEVAFFS